MLKAVQPGAEMLSGAGEGAGGQSLLCTSLLREAAAELPANAVSYSLFAFS